MQEQAFAHKYPLRDVDGWQDKAVKYRPGNCADAYNVMMGHLVSMPIACHGAWSATVMYS